LAGKAEKRKAGSKKPLTFAAEKHPFQTNTRPRTKSKNFDLNEQTSEILCAADW
jgi:hypothetical protein